MTFLWIFLGIIGGQLALALGLIASQRPAKNLRGEGLDFQRLPAGLPEMPSQSYTARDGTKLPLRHFPSASGPLLIMVHGSGWHGAQFATLGAKLADEGLAEVLVPDLRGHGAAPAKRGDIAYIDQLEDDLADLAKTYANGRGLILLGHSSGGGLVIRAANGALKGRLDKAILLAPYLKHNAPTARASSAWAAPLTRRIIGLSMLNMMRIRLLNGLTALQLRFPDAVLNGPLGHTTTRAYSYRLMLGFNPRAAYLKDISALPDFTLIAGSKDEAFHADRYEPTMSAVTDRGRYHLLPEQTHLSLVDAPATYALIKGVLS
jgi:alpha-beta hydrolase superfamily lysophospholipase